MQKIGRILLLQVQPTSIKVGKSERYDPTRLLMVDELLLSQPGVVGVTNDGRRIVDVHNANHPETKSRGDNGFSLGFTSHYRSMRSRFGAHIADACAGENILVETERMYSRADLQGGLAIEHKHTGEFFFLADIEPVVPCLPFSTYAMNRPLEQHEVKETLQFLMHGRRGFMAELADKGKTVSLCVGDMLYKL